MTYTTTCTKCGGLYEEQSNEASNEPDRKCLPCLREASATAYMHSSTRALELASMKPGMLVEDLYCYGWPEDFTLGTRRDEVIDFACRFEECDYSRDELARMSDKDVVAHAYSAMADYARGQM